MLALLLAGLLAAEDAAGFQEWLKFYAAAAGEYAIEAEEGGVFRPLALQPSPILQYTNPERGFQQHGAFYDAGRTAAVHRVDLVEHSRR